MSAPEAVASEPAFRAQWLDSKAGRRQLVRAAGVIACEPALIERFATVALQAYRQDRGAFAERLLDRARSAMSDMMRSSARTAALERLDAVEIIAALDAGKAPVGWWEAVERSLVLADADADSAGLWAPDLVGDACQIAFHRTIQLDAAMTPLAEDPAGFLRPFRNSQAIRRALMRSEWRQPAPFPGYEVVFLSEGNTNFLAPVQRLVERRSSTSVNLAAARDELPWRVSDFVATVVGGRTAQWDPMMRVLAGNASLVWAEWAQRQALIPSHSLPAGPRLVVRLHAFEVFTALPQLIRWDRVDDLVVVSPQMANAARAILPLPDSLAVSVCGIQVDPDRYVDAKSADARFTLAMVGHNSQVKDPAFALDVLDLVRAREPRARLLLIGEPMTATHAAQGPAAAAYANAHLDRVGGYVDSGLVTVVGRVDDVAAPLRSAGFVLSTSRRESFHLGLLEGALSGSIAVVRNWPIMAPFGGPRTFLPQRWVADDAAGMAERILAHMTDESSWEAERMRCRAEARAIAAASEDALKSVLADPAPGEQ